MSINLDELKTFLKSNYLDGDHCMVGMESPNGFQPKVSLESWIKQNEIMLTANDENTTMNPKIPELSNLSEVLKEFVDWLHSKPGINLPSRSSVDEFLRKYSRSKD